MTTARCLAPESHDPRRWHGAWAGQTVFVLASGPSLTLEDVNRVRHHARQFGCPVIAVNTSFLRAKWADALFFSHEAWWLHYKLAVGRTFEGMVATTANVIGPRVAQFTNGRLPEYGDTGANAIGLAIYMGAFRIIVLGMDGQGDSNGAYHWHPPHPPAVLARRSRRSAADGMARLVADAKTAGVEIVNVSPHSLYDGFVTARLSDYLIDMPAIPDPPVYPRRTMPPRREPAPIVVGGDPRFVEWRGRWKGRTVFVLASGPSLTEEDVTAVRDYATAHDCPVVVTNTTYRLAPWASLLFFYDRQWWRVHEQEVLDSFAGDIVTMAAINQPRVLSLFGERFNAYKNSGGGAINFAVYAGAKRIVLLGLDGQYAPDGRRHWHVQDPRLGNAGSLPRFVKQFPSLAASAATQGVEILNASRQTGLTCFRRVALEAIISPIPSED